MSIVRLMRVTIADSFVDYLPILETAMLRILDWGVYESGIIRTIALAISKPRWCSSSCPIVVVKRPFLEDMPCRKATLWRLLPVRGHDVNR